MVLALLLAGCAGLDGGERRVPRQVGGDRYSGEPADLPIRAWGFPEGATASKPRPAAILLHGCSGWYGDRIPEWGRRLADAGWVAIAVDSHAVRRAPDCDLDHPDYPSNFERRVDAYAALEWLAARPFVDPQRIAAIGFSDGGQTALGVLAGDAHRFFYDDGGPAFAASVAYYPGCNAWIRPELSAPAQIIVGSEDDWTPAPPCRHWRDIPAGDGQVEVRIIAGATHGFNLHTWRGQRLGPRTYQGHRLVPNGRAEAKAETYATDFLSRHVAPVAP